MTKTWQRMLSICTTIVGALALTVDAQAQATCGSSTGPDVIVGDITGPSNYTAVGSTEALSLGTTSCNLGNVWLNWFQNTNQHPVIGGTLYRYKVEPAGWTRFEQVGRSWLKHGFFALSQTLCCGCSSTDGTHLGIGCSDPYTSSRNGGQGGLGPRHQVNASTGGFTYPPANPSWSGTVARRLEVDTADLETGGGTMYFGECMYVTPDDAAAGNNHNNMSWRTVTWNGAGSFGFSGATVRQEAALNAWKVQDPAVTLVTANGAETSGASRYVLAYRTTDNGNGTWHYEYALYNMNSDNSARSFSVPVAPGAVLTNVGYHDVGYRNGDGPGNLNYDGTDWPSTESGGSITWSTDSFAANASANALRWSTTMNFRFDANVPPVVGNISVGLFKVPGLGPIVIQGDVPGVANVYTSFCWGDGSLPTACPCVAPNTVPSPSGAVGHGCANSFDLNGAELSASGTTTPDTLQLSVTVGGNYSAYAIMLKGDATNPNGVQNADGVLCVSGAIVRFGAHYAATGGAAPGEWTLPNALMPTPISTLTAQTMGQTAYYQLYYRNAAPNFCNPWGANWSNGMEVTWL